MSLKDRVNGMQHELSTFSPKNVRLFDKCKMRDQRTQVYARTLSALFLVKSACGVVQGEECLLLITGANAARDPVKELRRRLEANFDTSWTRCELLDNANAIVDICILCKVC